MRCTAFGLSDPGRVRKNNEDIFLCISELALYLVADGMGGNAAGEVASRLAADTVHGFIQRSTDIEEFSWPCGIDPQLSFDGNRLRTAIYLANRRVFRAAEEQDTYTGMGTTVVAALLVGSRLVVGHVGDSRLYIRAGGLLEQVTTDDSWPMTVLKGDPLSDNATLARHPLRGVLTNVLGTREVADIHVRERHLTGGEILLLCSDGLHTAVADQAIRGVLDNASDPRTASETLVATALTNGARDNVTVVVVQCQGA